MKSWILVRLTLYTIYWLLSIVCGKQVTRINVFAGLAKLASVPAGGGAVTASAATSSGGAPVAGGAPAGKPFLFVPSCSSLIIKQLKINKQSLLAFVSTDSVYKLYKLFF